ncbi:hypothetical protein [Lysinibacillus sp. RC79]|uniref:XkdW family protein n=1 Tax=Lysinibacillus sp. RC79 TaxID=3156296 RepID=UPI0035165744
MFYKPRDENGQPGEVVHIGSTPDLETQIAALGMQLTQEKLANMQNNIQKDALINDLGAQVAQMKLELIALKGGEKG